jgi:aryl-alcohol dehydrogenase-like predicted oxidoreductase
LHYQALDRTGIKVSPYALGTLMFASSVGNPDHEDSIRIIRKALDAGINFVDTADAYGDSEGSPSAAGSQASTPSSRPTRS